MKLEELFVIRPTNEEQNDFIITVGQHLATEQHFKTSKEAETYRDTPKWEMILALVAEMLTVQEERKKNESEIKAHAKTVVNSIISKTIKEK